MGRKIISHTRSSRIGTVYLLTFSSGKKYVGITVQRLERRLAYHRHDALINKLNRPVCTAWRKHGQPSVEVLMEIEATKLKDTEVRFIRELNTQLPNGYNVLPGGELGRLGLKHATETCAKMSSAWRAHYAVPENFDKLVQARRKAYEDHPDLRARISELAKVRFSDPEQRAALTRRVRAQMADPQMRARLSESAKRRMENPAERQRISDSLKGRKASLEIRAKMSAGQKRRRALSGPLPSPMLGKKMSPEAKAKIAAARRRYFENPENRAKISAAVKAGKAKAKEVGP